MRRWKDRRGADILKKERERERGRKCDVTRERGEEGNDRWQESKTRTRETFWDLFLPDPPHSSLSSFLLCCSLSPTSTSSPHFSWSFSTSLSLYCLIPPHLLLFFLLSSNLHLSLLSLPLSCIPIIFSILFLLHFHHFSSVYSFFHSPLLLSISIHSPCPPLYHDVPAPVLLLVLLFPSSTFTSMPLYLILLPPSFSSSFSPSPRPPLLLPLFSSSSCLLPCLYSFPPPASQSFSLPPSSASNISSHFIFPLSDLLSTHLPPSLLFLFYGHVAADNSSIVSPSLSPPSPPSIPSSFPPDLFIFTSSVRGSCNDGWLQRVGANLEQSAAERHTVWEGERKDGETGKRGERGRKEDVHLRGSWLSASAPSQTFDTTT